MKTAVIVFPGSNCDRDAEVAARSNGEVVRVWHRDASLPAGVDLVILPGGFSYGDYLRCGAMSARSPIMAAVRTHADRGGYVLGICNGFQVLTEARLLPGALMRNHNLRFICRSVTLRVERSAAPFLTGYAAGEVIRLPVAHHDGNYRIDEDGLKRLEDGGQIALRYCDAAGALSEAANINGSIASIAGITNEAGNVMGMMPHPERSCDMLTGGTDGVRLLRMAA